MIRSKHKSRNQWGKDNPCWRGGKSTYYCMECGKGFTSHPSEYARGGARFCSRECGYEHKRRRTKQVCEICGKEFDVKIYDIERGKGRLCSRECSGKWKSENFSGEKSHMFGKKKTPEQIAKTADAIRGENHYNWKGGITPANRKIRNSAEYKKWQQAVFSRDDYTCCDCKKRGGYLHAHHVLSFSDCPEKRLDVDNGITLCLGCHYKLTYHGVSLVS